LDGDELREWLSPKDYSQGARIEHNKKVAHIAKLPVEHNLPVCVSLISPYVINREDARNIIDKRNFIELYIKCSLKTCEYRDVKFMYSRARNGQIKNLLV
jgi:adenylylsulfate kinase